MNQSSHLGKLLENVWSDRVRFASMRPPGSPFSSIGRRIVVTEPPEAVQLSTSGDPRALDALLPLLEDRDRAWGAEVLLSAMTGLESDRLASAPTEPPGWWDTMGKTARERWRKPIESLRGQLVWNTEQRMFERVGAKDAG